MKYLVLGASASGLNGAREIRTLDRNGDITLVSIDDKVYSRCMLHYYIGQKRTEESCTSSEAFFCKKAKSVCEEQQENLCLLFGRY